MPCAIRAVPPPTANPYSTATRKTMVATWRWKSLTGTGSSSASGRTRRGLQLRVFLFPRLPDAARQPAPDLRPYTEQDAGIQVGREVLRAAGLAEHGFIQPGPLVIVAKVEAPVWTGPEQPHRQLNLAHVRAAQRIQVPGHERAAPGPGLMPAP